MSNTAESIDIRLAIGEPVGESPLRMTCPAHIHKARIGQEDKKQSLAIYRDGLHCFGCNWHVKRRYAALAFLLGYWNGLGEESKSAIYRVRQRLGDFVGAAKKEAQPHVPPLDPYVPEAFHQFLLGPMSSRLEYLQLERGLDYGTICMFKLGHTGTHFSFPVYDQYVRLFTIRYRSDDRFSDKSRQDYRKYEGTWGRNQPILYPLNTLDGATHLNELWIVEGEFDAISSNQAGNITLTITNGATNLVKLYSMFRAIYPAIAVNRFVLAGDQDGAGDKAMLDLKQVLDDAGERSVRARWSKVKDLNEYYSLGGGRKGIWYEG